MLEVVLRQVSRVVGEGTHVGRHGGYGPVPYIKACAVMLEHGVVRVELYVVGVVCVAQQKVYVTVIGGRKCLRPWGGSQLAQPPVALHIQHHVQLPVGRQRGTTVEGVSCVNGCVRVEASAKRNGVVLGHCCVGGVVEYLPRRVERLRGHGLGGRCRACVVERDYTRLVGLDAHDVPLELPPSHHPRRSRMVQVAYGRGVGVVVHHLPAPSHSRRAAAVEVRRRRLRGVVARKHHGAYRVARGYHSVHIVDDRLVAKRVDLQARSVGAVARHGYFQPHHHAVLVGGHGVVGDIPS
ncbi:MAG: hypothetical protein K6A41_04330 [Bacteroidales bacterium]|nr:hypothetical protein [Bacteroidales bacterium]